MDSSMSGQQTQADTHSCSDKFIRVDSDSGEGELYNLIAMKQACHVWENQIFSKAGFTGSNKIGQIENALHNSSGKAESKIKGHKNTHEMNKNGRLIYIKLS